MVDAVIHTAREQGEGKRTHTPRGHVTPSKVQMGSRKRKRVMEKSTFYVQSAEIHMLFKELYSMHMALTFYG